ncbi:hypothetical protein [Tropicimonas aquimaris]|uniref:Uncharacterized protein n=1 Tax=Tropicimonas aquimaris TaxID=914152 RepID=A0ABW3INU9_9RHOB
MRVSLRSLLLPLLVAAGTAAEAQTWSSAIATNGESAGGLITVGEKTLTLGCNRNTGTWLSLVLTGGPHAGMKNADDTADDMMMWIVLSGGNRAKHPILGFYYEADKAFVGRLETSDTVLREFAQGSTLELTSPSGDVIFEAPMTGTGAFREQILEACGI